MYQGNYLTNNLRVSSLDADGPFLVETVNHKQLSYSEFFQAAEAYAYALVEKGLEPGDRVAVQVDKSIEVLKLYIATIMAGGVFLPLNTAYTPKEIEYFLSNARPRIFVCPSARVQRLKPIANSYSVDVVETMNGDGGGSLYDLAIKQAAGFRAVAREKDDLAAILYTSGTTGQAKGAMLSHGNLWSNAAALRDYWQFSVADQLIHALPIFHTHGLIVATNITLAAGSSLIFMQRFNPDAVIDAMQSATVFMGVPTCYVRLLNLPRLDRQHTRNMRLFISGSAPLLKETHRQWQDKTGHAILERYGMTETNMNTSNPYEGERRAGTVGFPLPEVEVRVMDGETELSKGAIGAIEVRGPNVFKGYWRMPEKTKEEMRDDGFFITGDLGFFDERGYLPIIGRSKDLIISGGYNVYPREIEKRINDLDGVLESAVFGVPHSDFGEAVCAAIVKSTDGDISEDSVMHSIRDDLARYKQPKRIFFVDELPRNTMGKVTRKDLCVIYAETFSE